MNPNDPSLPPGPPLFPPPPVVAPESPSGAPKVLGILSLIFGGLTTLGGLATCFSSLMSGRMGGVFGGFPGMPGGRGGPDPDRMREAYAMMADASWANLTEGIVFVVLSVALMVIGVGQLRYRAWAAGASRAWGVVALVALGGLVVLHLTVIGPATQRMIEHMLGDAPGETRRLMESMLGIMSAVAGPGAAAMKVVFYAPYPIALLAAFGGARVRESMTT